MQRFLKAAIAPLLIGACTPMTAPVNSPTARTIVQPADPALGIRPQAASLLVAYEARTPSPPGSWQGANGSQSTIEGGSN
jgi:hypothetical protein